MAGINLMIASHGVGTPLSRGAVFHNAVHRLWGGRRCRGKYSDHNGVITTYGSFPPLSGVKRSLLGRFKRHGSLARFTGNWDIVMESVSVVNKCKTILMINY